MNNIFPSCIPLIDYDFDLEERIVSQVREGGYLQLDRSEWRDPDWFMETNWDIECQGVHKPSLHVRRIRQVKQKSRKQRKAVRDRVAPRIELTMASPVVEAIQRARKREQQRLEHEWRIMKQSQSMEDWQREHEADLALYKRFNTELS